METLKTAKNQFFGFCATTSIHGLRYVGDDATTVTSRIVWFVAVAISFVLAGWNIYSSVTGYFNQAALKHNEMSVIKLKALVLLF